VRTAALIVAAGRGTRAAGAIGAKHIPKQYAPLAGKAIVMHSLHAFAAINAIQTILVVIHADDGDLYADSVNPLLPKLRAPAIGGQTRQQSVLNGLEALRTEGIDKVLIHDAARPFVSSGTILAVIGALDHHVGAIAGVPLADTLKRASAGSSRILETIPREDLWRAQTPQGFRYQSILEAHRRAAEAGLDEFTDDAAIAEWAGLDVALVEDSAANSKITTLEDLEMAEMRAASAPRTRSSLLEPRTGSGFDVHRFTAGDHVWLCGVRIPHDQALEGHSDADVGLHALTDALLGAIGDGDIGQHFPPSDAQWKGAPSHLFLADAARRVGARGGRIANVDVTLLCEAPRIGPHRPAMQGRIAEILGLEPSRVGVKATTTEGLGFTGRREGIAAIASALVMVPWTAESG